MILLIDIGNSRTKYVKVIDEKLSDTVQVINTEFNEDYFTQHFSQASVIVVANVASGSLTQTLELWCAERTINFQQVHSEQKKGVLTSAYQQPTTLGIDRWLALLGAIHLYPNENVLIIDAGTATTVDFVDHKGQHQGGWILAGIQALFNSILSHSTLVYAKRNEDKDSKPSLGFGSTTSDNVNNACWAATVGMIEQSIQQAKLLGDIDRVLFTGGNGDTLAQLIAEQKNQHSDRIHSKVQYLENLIFYGLKVYIPESYCQ